VSDCTRKKQINNGRPRTSNAWQSPACSPQTRQQNSGTIERNFNNVLSDVEKSSAVLTRAYMLRSSHPLWNARASNEGGYANFRRFTQTSVTIATSLEQSRK